MLLQQPLLCMELGRRHALRVHQRTTQKKKKKNRSQMIDYLQYKASCVKWYGM